MVVQMPSCLLVGVCVCDTIAGYPFSANMSAPTSSEESNIATESLVQLRTLSLDKLQSGSASEQSVLLQACMEDGFFLLDFTQSGLSGVLDDVESVLKLAEDLFNYPLDVKTLFDVDKVSELKVNGYKPKGRNIVNKDGQSDGFESWVVSFDERNVIRRGRMLTYSISSHATGSSSSQKIHSHTHQ